VEQSIADLIARSNRLGSDRRVTNYAGGNTSAKVALPDAVTGEAVRVLVVKGSGGDLGTLREPGLAYLRLDRLLALGGVRSSGVHEDDLVELYAQCVFGSGGAVPSIDTPLHALIDVDHVDHLHPDAVIALAASADGRELTSRCYGDEVGFLDWKRPGFDLAIELLAFRREHPEAKGVVLGGHGLINWAPTSDACEALSLDLIARAELFIEANAKPDPFGPVTAGYEALSHDDRRREAAAFAPVIRGLASTDGWTVGSFSDAPEVLDFLSRREAPRLAALGTSCPDHFLRTKVRPLFLDLPSAVSRDERIARLCQLHEQYRRDYAAYYDAHATDDSPAMRGADPAVVLVGGVGMFSFGPDVHGARIAGEFYVNAINVMKGAEAVSSYVPIPESEKFRIEYWSLEERKLVLRPKPGALQGRVAFVTGGASGIGLAISSRLAEAGACVAIADRDIDSAEKAVAEIGAGRAIAIGADVTDEASIDDAFACAALAFGGVDIVVNNAGFARSAPLVDTTTEDWDALHDVLARGSFLVSRAAARVMLAQGRGGDIVYVVSKNAVVAGPSNVAYASAKADQAHQVRLLAAELGPHEIRVNGVNPDGVVRGSGIFSGEWLEQRAKAYGVEPDDLGAFYASRTLLGREVLPSHVAAAVFALVAGDLDRTTGLIVPVDGGLPEAFIR
jgi:rhamnulose-1-phosphate aldolase/alcohol dehydrogenase